jgi:hypothetical protein
MNYILIDDLKFIGPQDENVPDRIVLSDQYPFLEYAARFLFYHLRKAEAGKETMSHLLDQLHDPKGRLWSRWTFVQQHFNIESSVFQDGVPPIQALCEMKLFCSAMSLMGNGIDIDSRDKLALPLFIMRSDSKQWRLSSFWWTMGTMCAHKTLRATLLCTEQPSCLRVHRWKNYFILSFFNSDV